jgi:hypothetical protein
MKRILKRTLGLGLVAAAACSDGPCVIPPCVYTFAVRIRISSGAGAAVANAFVKDASTGASAGSCDAAGCMVGGGRGTYDLQIGAPGFQSVNRTVVVTGSEPSACGCPRVDTQTIDVSLAPVG